MQTNRGVVVYPYQKSQGVQENTNIETDNASRTTYRDVTLSNLTNINYFRQLNDMAGRIADQEGIKHPSIIIYSKEFPHPVTMSRYDKVNPVLRINEKLLTLLNQGELEAVVAHEMWHLKSHFDKNVGKILKYTDNFIFAIASSAVTVDMFAFVWYAVNHNKPNANEVYPFFTHATPLILSSAGTFFTKFLKRNASILNESMADAYSAKLTKHPENLASALIKVSNKYHGKQYLSSPDKQEGFMQLLRRMNLQFSESYIFATHTTEEEKTHKSISQSITDYLFCTHPPLYDRVHHLARLKEKLNTGD